MANPYKELPKKLEDDLNEVKYYRRKSSNPTVDKLLNNNNENYLNYQSSTDDIHSHHPKVSKQPSLQRVFDDSYENKMYDEIFGGLLPSANRAKLPAGSGFEATRRSTSQEKDFTSSLINRLKVLESENKEQRKQLSQQIAENLKLEEKVRIFEESTSKQQKDHISKAQHLSRENRRLQQQIYEMESFLADYGLTWVGSQPDADTQTESEREEEKQGDMEGHLVSFIDFERRIKELNDVIYSDPAQIRAEKKKARLVSASELAEKIVVTYYADGLMINRGPFRPTASESYKSFVQDIMDGYFPSEFRQTFPDGVLFDLRNREHVRFEEEKEGDFMSVSDFLRRLPKTMIKNGDVIDLHKDVRMRLSLDGPVSDLMRGEREGEVASGHQENRHLNHQIITLPTEAGDEQLEQHQQQPQQLSTTKIQVKWKDSTSFIVRMYNYQTIGDLRKVLLQYHNKNNHSNSSSSNSAGSNSQRRRDSSAPSFELIRSFPTRKLEDHETFQSADLVPNGILHTHFLK